MATWQATILTLFPEMFPGPLGVSLLGKALANGLWSLEVRDIREHGLGKHRTVDDTPAGGGPGMVMRADVAAAAIDAVERQGRPLIYLSPRGSRLTQARVRDLAAGPGAILLCGRFEGLDQRVIEAPRDRGNLAGRFRAGGRRDCRHGLDRGFGAADPGRAGRPGIHRGGKLRRSPAWNIRISPALKASRKSRFQRF